MRVKELGCLVAVSVAISAACDQPQATKASPSSATSTAAHADAPSKEQAAAEIEAIATARTLRNFYPLALEADDAAAEAADCVGGNPRQKPAKARECAKALTKKLEALRAREPARGELTGCSRFVADSVSAAIGDLEKATRTQGLWDMGVEFDKIHRGYGECASGLFRCGALDKPTDPCKARELEGHLGLRDDEPPGPATYRKPRDGKLWLADGREVNRETLRVMSK